MKGALRYEGARGNDAAHLSVWRFQLFGGMPFLSDSADPREEITHAGAIVGRRAFLDRIELPDRI